MSEQSGFKKRTTEGRSSPTDRPTIRTSCFERGSRDARGGKRGERRGESRHKERRSTVVVNESSSRSFLAFRPRGHRTKAPGCCLPPPSWLAWSLKTRNLPLSCVRSASQRRRKEGREGRKEERNGTAGSVSEPYISAGTNCPIIHSVRQLRCSPLIHRCYFPPSSPFLPFFSLLSPSLRGNGTRNPYTWLLPRSCLSSRLCFSLFQFVCIRDQIILIYLEIPISVDLIGEGREEERRER